MIYAASCGGFCSAERLCTGIRNGSPVRRLTDRSIVRAILRASLSEMVFLFIFMWPPLCRAIGRVVVALFDIETRHLVRATLLRLRNPFECCPFRVEETGHSIRILFFDSIQEVSSILRTPRTGVPSNSKTHTSKKIAPLFVRRSLFDWMLNSNCLFVFGKEPRSIQPPQCPGQLTDRLA